MNISVMTLEEDYIQWRCEEGQLAGNWVSRGALAAGFKAGCSSCSMTNSFVTNAQLIERAVSC